MITQEIIIVGFWDDKKLKEHYYLVFMNIIGD